MATIQVDFSPVVKDITRVLQKAESAAQAERAIMWGLNQVGDKALTKVRRTLSHQTSVRYGRVAKDVKGARAHPNRLAYKIKATDQAIPLREMLNGTVRPGQKNVPYLAWGKKLVAKNHVFIIGPGRGGKTRFKRGRASGMSAGATFPVKRVRNGHNAGSLKAMWGPVVPLQMLSTKRETFRYLETVVPVEFVPVLEQKLAAIMAGAGTKKP